MSADVSIDELRSRLRTIRRAIITSTTEAGSGHPTSSLSAAEVGTALYFGGFLRYKADDCDWPQRDRFILSKGHAAPLLYALLAEAGYFPKEQLPTLRKLGSPLEGHPNYRRLPGVEASTGSLGQGLSLGVGHVLATRLDGYDSRTFVMTGDGEVNQGQIWEAVMSAVKFKLENLIAIVDQNGYQQTGSSAEVLDLSPLAPKFETFGWLAKTINGNNLTEVIESLTWATTPEGAPKVIISQTQKGYPLMDILGDPNHHGKPLTAEQAEKALAFLDSTDM